jgi:hypothetical protein
MAPRMQTSQRRYSRLRSRRTSMVSGCALRISVPRMCCRRRPRVEGWVHTPCRRESRRIGRRPGWLPCRDYPTACPEPSECACLVFHECIRVVPACVHFGLDCPQDRAGLAQTCKRTERTKEQTAPLVGHTTKGTTTVWAFIESQCVCTPVPVGGTLHPTTVVTDIY